MDYYGNNDWRDYHLAHFGIKGMHWGVRRSQPYGKGGYSPKEKPSSKTRKRAKKDAKEYARAQMYYGEGAGNRRKLIKATVEERSKDPYYKEQFEKYLAEQDMAKHVGAAKRERRTRDTANAAKKGAKTAARVAFMLSQM